MKKNNKILNDLVVEIATEGSIYNDIINNIMQDNNHQKNELISEIAIGLLGGSNERKEALVNILNSGGFKYYFIRIIITQIKSNSSGFHRNARETISNRLKAVSGDLSHLNLIDDDEDRNNKIQVEINLKRLQQARKQTKCSYFEREIFSMYYDAKMTYREIAEDANISLTLAYFTVKNMQDKLRKIINK